MGVSLFQYKTILKSRRTFAANNANTTQYFSNLRAAKMLLAGVFFKKLTHAGDTKWAPQRENP